MRITLMYTHMNKPPGLLLVVEVSFPRYWCKPKKENMKRRNMAYKIRTTEIKLNTKDLLLLLRLFFSWPRNEKVLFDHSKKYRCICQVLMN